MNEKSGRGQSRFDVLKGCWHVRCPGEGTGIAGRGISEGAENGGGVRHKTVVKID